MTLMVDRTSGGAWLTGPTGASFDIQGYSISSAEGELTPGNWSPLQDSPSFGNGNPNDLSGWETLGPGSEDQVGEFNADGSSVFGDSGTDEMFLGNIFSPNGAEDLQLSISLASGGLVQGAVEYFTGTVIAGDYNQDGVVDAADYTVWRNNLGGASLPNETVSPGIVDQEDYLAWKDNFGFNSGGALAATTSAVPEPSSLLLLSPLFLAMCVPGLRQRLNSSMRLFAAVLVCCVMASSASAARTVDRDYRLGDDPTEPGSDAGNPVGGFTYDSVGSAPADWHDLTKVGNPVYTSVASRPFVTPYSGSTLGITFSGEGDYFQGLDSEEEQGLGSPGSVNNPNADYAGITTRGIQMWVLPTASGTGMRQDLINDTFQFGIHITESDTWGMTWGAPAYSPVPQTYGSSAPVAFNEWTHVQQHSVDNGLGVLYVDGMAVAASFPGETYQIHEFGGTSLDFTVGASLALDGSQAFTGTLDDIEVYVAGSNAEMDYGTFTLEEDNEFIANYLSDNNYVVGDLTGDAAVTGDGSGGPGDDVALFVSNWNTRKRINGSLVGDLETRLAGDFNYDGVVNLFDWTILRNNHVHGASLDLGLLLEGGHAVPEPTAWSVLLGFLGLAYAAKRYRYCQSASRRLAVRTLPVVAVLSLSATAGAAGLWNVDFQGMEGSTAYGQDGLNKDFGPDPVSGIWNVFEVASAASDPQVDFTDDPSLALVDNDGNASSVVLSLEGPVAGWNGTADQHALYGDYVIIAPGVAGYPEGPLRMTLSGLVPMQEYSMRVAGSPVAGWTLRAKVDADGDGTVENDTLETFPGNTTLEANPTLKFVADAAGNAIAEFIRPDEIRETDLAALQLKVGDFVPTLTIDRVTGAITLANNTVTESYQLTGYSIVSESAGALSPQAWMSITDNYDANGDESVDADFNWFEFTNSSDRDDLSESQAMVPGAAGTPFADGDSIFLGNAWIANPVEDIDAHILIENSEGLAEVVAVDVNFTGPSHLLGDFDNNGDLTVDDWSILKGGFSSDISDLSMAEKYRLGDINLDGAINLRDARRFVQEYELLNGAGSLALAGGASVPEPASLLLLACAVGGGLCHRGWASRRGRRTEKRCD